MDKSPAPINTNDHYIKACILYDVIKKRPIFDSYRNFCKLIGQDVMEYLDYEFWYYRFYHQQLDFDYDRSSDPVPKTIMDMPVSIMYKITGNLDTVDRIHLRSMNKSIKEVVDSYPPIFPKISIEFIENGLIWKLDNKKFKCSKKGSGCILFRPNCSNIKSNKHYVTMGLEYLSPVFKIPGFQTNRLTLKLIHKPENVGNFLPVPFHVKSVAILAWRMEHVLSFLSAFNPGELETIRISSTHAFGIDETLRFFETEQFKQAKHVQYKMQVIQNWIERFSHLKSFEFFLHFPGPLDFQITRDIISTFEEFEYCKIKVPCFLSDMWFSLRTVGRVFEEEMPFGPLKTINHRYRIPESNEFLEFKIEDEGRFCSMEIFKIR
ncbi:unnamed protein product [Caenorhabditis nigoni]